MKRIHFLFNKGEAELLLLPQGKARCCSMEKEDQGRNGNGFLSLFYDRRRESPWFGRLTYRNLTTVKRVLSKGGGGRGPLLL